MSSACEKVKKKPERRCAGCSEHREKNELIRVVRSPDGQVSLDFTGKASGRGVYICRDAACLKKARKARRFESSLKVEIPTEVYERLERELEEK
ncbi:MAG: YlxR family protein [Clostridia bacterium]|nr:YlxR family protein [Clostridia bacterium]